MDVDILGRPLFCPCAQKDAESPTAIAMTAISFLWCLLCAFWGFPGGSEVKASASNAGGPGSIPGSGRSPGEGNGNPLQYSCLENPMEGGTWWTVFLPGQSHACRSLVGYSYSPRSRKESDTTERLHFVPFTKMTTYDV